MALTGGIQVLGWMNNLEKLFASKSDGLLLKKSFSSKLRSIYFVASFISFSGKLVIVGIKVKPLSSNFIVASVIGNEDRLTVNCELLNRSTLVDDDCPSLNC